MSQGYVDEVFSGLSHDAHIDTGWTEVKTASGSKADVDVILESLHDLYWKGVQKEIAGAIVALADFDQYHPDALPVESPSEEELLSSDKLSGLLKLWDPWENKKSPGLRTAHLESIQRNVEDSVKLFCDQDLRKRRARSLLQALGLLDIDFVREHREPVFRSWGQRPQVDDSLEPLLQARQCSKCRHCIRSFHWYQCVEGCLDNEGYGNRNLAKMNPVQKHTEHNSLDSAALLKEIVHESSLNTMIGRQKLPYVLCPTCLTTSTHSRKHLRTFKGFAKQGYGNLNEFARELDVWEDHLDGRSLLSLGTIIWDKLVDVRSSPLGSSRQFFPAGNAHCTLMFGPLLIENGVTRKPGGALISIRNMPNLTASSSKELLEFLADPSAWHMVDGEEVVHNDLLSVSGDRRVYAASKPVKQRRFMSSRKQVAGGLFTGHCTSFLEREEEILDAFIQCTDAWKVMKARDNTQAGYRTAMNDFSGFITNMMKQAFSFEVRKLLFCFAARLGKHTKLQYNRLSNSCQDFCNAMLINNDTFDQVFNSTYPPLPSNREYTLDIVHLRYMMSFSGKILHPMHEMPFVNPLVSSVPLYDTFGHNDADLIDHVTSIRLYSEGASTQCHDEILVKESQFTCPRVYDEDGTQLQGKPCTQASHLLDGPHDNLSVLSFHIHRPRSQYTVRTTDPSYSFMAEDEFLSNRGPLAWVSNRLEVLHRLLLLNTYLACITAEFQSKSDEMTWKELEKSWKPPKPLFARAWHNNKRTGSNLVRPTWNEEMKGPIGSIAATVMMNTHSFMQETEIWKTRMSNLKRRLHDEAKDKTGVFKDTPWTNCDCKRCILIFSMQNCYRAMSYSASQEDREPAMRKYVKSHPDYVSVEQLRSSVQVIGEGDEVVTALLAQMTLTPEYFEATER